MNQVVQSTYVCKGCMYVMDSLKKRYTVAFSICMYSLECILTTVDLLIFRLQRNLAHVTQMNQMRSLHSPHLVLRSHLIVSLMEYIQPIMRLYVDMNTHWFLLRYVFSLHEVSNTRHLDYSGGSRNMEMEGHRLQTWHDQSCDSVRATWCARAIASCHLWPCCWLNCRHTRQELYVWSTRPSHPRTVCTQSL